MSVRVRVIAFAGAGTAEGAPILEYFALEVDAFAALGADDARAFETGKILRMDFDLHPFLRKQHIVGKLSVGLLLSFFAGQIRKEISGGLLGRLFRSDADGAAGLEVAECGSDFAPVAEFQRALA